MAQKLIRDIPDETIKIIEEKAGADGMNAEAWIRSQLIRIAAQPTIKKQYSFKAFGENGARITLRRFPEGGIGGGASGCSQEQYAAYQKAKLLCERNNVGDYESAYALLSGQFDEVFPG